MVDYCETCGDPMDHVPVQEEAELCTKCAALEEFGDTIGHWLELTDDEIGYRLRAYYNLIESPTWDAYTAEEIRGIRTFLEEGLHADIPVHES